MGKVLTFDGCEFSDSSAGWSLCKIRGWKAEPYVGAAADFALKRCATAEVAGKLADGGEAKPPGPAATLGAE
jgi:hypothetical protein